MPYIVQELIKDNPTLMTASLQEPIQSALAKMIEHDFSQLPVVDDDNRPVGMITSESILRALNNFGVGLDKLRVEHARVKPDEFRHDADLFELLNRLQDTYAVLIVDGERRLIGIVTNYDTAEYFRRRAEDMMLVEDIETMLKDYIQAAYATDDGGIDEARLDRAVQKITDSGQAHRKKFEKALSHYLALESGGGKVKLNDASLQEVFERHFDDKRPAQKFSELTLYEYIELLLDESSWTRYRPIFNLDRSAIRTLLDKVRDTRNILAHFRREITLAQHDHLRFAADWLAHYQDAIMDLFTPRATSPAMAVREPQATYQAGSSQAASELPVIAPLEDEVDPRESRYAPLAIWLQNQPPNESQVTLTFADIERIIENKLPGSAYEHRSWWANDSFSHVQSQQWLEVDWRVALVNMSNHTVHFARIQERQKAYIDFFSELVSELKQQPGFDQLQVRPDGVNWYWIRSIRVKKKRIGTFTYSFGRGNIFRVELYIDSDDGELNKTLFDALNGRKAEIEEAVGYTLLWQRLNHRRASRIAIIFEEYSITDDLKRLAQLRQQAVPAMVKFIEVMRPHIESEAKNILP
ncbi:MAG: DUF4268 domain-containing protein [Chloroflexi bacterium]|nr:DUF4268 domain-containing protein [Chloroflexota bacterium]MCI0730815.1 DUF4268 domain-containing protein [Chloroflexota bacterium]